MLNAEIKQQIKATTPILQEHGVTLTKHFYARLFSHHPDMKPMFNQGHQAAGSQQQALAQAVLAYATHIENPSVLLPVLQMVAQKHVSLGIRAEHYAIIGQNLLAAIQEVLQLPEDSPVINAWAAAYGELADLMIGLEDQLYAQNCQTQGGYSGWRAFKIIDKVMESTEICSFYLQPADGGAAPDFQAGQYLSVRLAVPELGYIQARQYSLSDAPGKPYLRISVKRESAGIATPAGMVSNRLHDHYKVGDLLDVSAPVGDFVLQHDSNKPLVLISAGVGVTPVWSMLEQQLQQNAGRPIHFIHACRNGAVHAFKPRLQELRQRYSALTAMVYYETPLAEDQPGRDYDKVGRFDPTASATLNLPVDAEYYLCGPKEFLLAQRAALTSVGIDKAALKMELFNTGGFAI